MEGRLRYAAVGTCRTGIIPTAESATRTPHGVTLWPGSMRPWPRSSPLPGRPARTCRPSQRARPTLLAGLRKHVGPTGSTGRLTSTAWPKSTDGTRPTARPDATRPRGPRRVRRGRRGPRRVRRAAGGDRGEAEPNGRHGADGLRGEPGGIGGAVGRHGRLGADGPLDPEVIQVPRTIRGPAARGVPVNGAPADDGRALHPAGPAAAAQAGPGGQGGLGGAVRRAGLPRSWPPRQAGRCRDWRRSARSRRSWPGSPSSCCACTSPAPGARMTGTTARWSESSTRRRSRELAAQGRGLPPGRGRRRRRCPRPDRAARP